MTSAFIVGFVIGFLICIPVGPINLWSVNTLIKRNFKSAISIAFGASLMDFIYFIIILSGLSLFSFSNRTMSILKVLGVIVLLIFGIKELMTAEFKLDLTEEEKKKAPKATSYFFLGVLIYISNPTLVASMTALAGLIRSWSLFPANLSTHLALSIGLSAGTFSWFVVLLKTVEKYQHKIPEKFFVRFSKACGLFIITFSLYMAFNVYKELFL
jgi:threonine/homoserine/homoserine lactone efflux protein